MEGILLKCTKYFLGWQPRYFALEGLFLTYYRCKGDEGMAAQGSRKMALCEIRELKPGDPCLRGKVSELQLCCHLLAERVQLLQGRAAVWRTKPSETCFMLLGTLEDCIRMPGCGFGPHPCA